MKLLQRPSLSDLIAAVRACNPRPDKSLETPKHIRIFRPPLVCNRILNGVRLAPYFIPPRSKSVVDLRLALDEYVTSGGDRAILEGLYDEQVTRWLFPYGKPFQHNIATLLWAISRLSQRPLKFAKNSIWVESDTFLVGVVNGEAKLRFTKGLHLPEYDYRKSVNAHEGERPTEECNNRGINRLWLDLATHPDRVVARRALSLLYHTVKDTTLLVRVLYEGGSLK